MQQTPYCHCWIKDSLTNHWSSLCSNAESVSRWYFQPAVSNCVYLCYVEHEFWSKLKQDSPKTALFAGFADTNSPGSGGTLSKHKHCSFFIFRMITWRETPPHRFQKWRIVASNRLSVYWKVLVERPTPLSQPPEPDLKSTQRWVQCTLLHPSFLYLPSNS